MSAFPLLGVTQVLSRAYNPNSVNPWGLYVMHPTIQGTGVLVQMGFHGSADALRVSQKALPTEGTWGVVLWPYGDSRNGVWLCSLYTQGNSAVLPSSGDLDYEAHPSGAWRLLDQIGNFTFALPDGSYFVFGNGGAKPALTRQVVQPNQQAVTQAYPDSTRQRAVPPPFPAVLSMAAGQVVTFATDGSITIMPKSGEPVTVHGDLHVTGAVIAGYGGADQVGLQTHTHSTPDGESGPPTAGT